MPFIKRWPALEGPFADGSSKAQWGPPRKPDSVEVRFYGEGAYAPPEVTFDAQGAARVPIATWSSSGQDGAHFTVTNRFATVHATSISVLRPATVFAGLPLFVSGLLGQYESAYVQYEPFERSWAEARHAYGRAGLPRDR